MLHLINQEFDKRNKRIRTIEKDKRSKEWHTHYGYEHAEYGKSHPVPEAAADL